MSRVALVVYACSRRLHVCCKWQSQNCRQPAPSYARTLICTHPRVPALRYAGEGITNNLAENRETLNRIRNNAVGVGGVLDEARTILRRMMRREMRTKIFVGLFAVVLISIIIGLIVWSTKKGGGATPQ